MGKFHLTIALWGGLCGSATAEPPAPDAAAAPAISDAGVRSEYSAMRHAFLATLAEEGVDGVLETGGGEACLEPWMFMAPSDRVSDGVLATLALDAATVENLAAAGAGDGTWSAKLADFEAQMLETRERGGAGFKASYAEARRAFVLSLMPEEGMAGMQAGPAHMLDCMTDNPNYSAIRRLLQGAGDWTAGRVAGQPSRLERGIRVSLLSDPEGASIRMISRWNKLVCEGKRIDLMDFEACDGWTELASGSSASVLGDYYYHATWPDGSTKSGQIAFNRSVETSRVVFGKSGPLVR